MRGSGSKKMISRGGGGLGNMKEVSLAKAKEDKYGWCQLRKGYE